MKILIAGSCVSRDALTFLKNDYELISYHARSSLATLNFKSVSESYFAQINNISSNFQKKMVEFDFNRELLCNIEKRQYDLLFMDLIDERFNLGVLGDNCLITCSSEFYKTNIQPNNIVLANTPDFMQAWYQGVDVLFNKLIDLDDINKVRVQKAFWTSTLDNGLILEKYPPKIINQQNDKLKKMYEYLEKYLLPEQFIDIPSDLIKINSNHKWGVSPFHYIDNYYEFIISKLLDNSIVSFS